MRVKTAIMRQLERGIPASVRHVVQNGARRPRVPAAAAPPRDGALRVASYNVHKCVGVDGRFDPDRIRRVIGELDADVVALQEADRRFGDRSGLLDLSLLAAETGLVPVPVAGLREAAHGWHGNLILVRRGLVQGVQQVALPGLEPRGAVVADLDFGPGRALRVIGAHLGLLRRCRRRQAGALADFLAPQDSRPAVLMGDLNEWRIDEGSPLIRFAEEGLPAAPPSFPSRFPLLPLDRIISTRPALLSGVHVHDSALARLASDHLPITACWSPGETAHQA